MENEATPIDPLMRSLATNVGEASASSNRNLFKLGSNGLSFCPVTPGGFFVGLVEMRERYHLSFGGLEETSENIRSAIGLFLLALSPVCRLRVRVSRRDQIWTLSEWAHGYERRILAECGYPLRGRSPVSDETWTNQILTEKECLRLQRMFRCG